MQQKSLSSIVLGGTAFSNIGRAGVTKQAYLGADGQMPSAQGRWRVQPSFSSLAMEPPFLLGGAAEAWGGKAGERKDGEMRGEK